MRIVRNILLVLMFASCCCHAQEVMVRVGAIQLQGNTKTKDDVILRELALKTGETVPAAQLTDLLEQSKQMIMNTGLFSAADVKIDDWETPDNVVNLLVTVKETWYIYPVPYFELADRNFNVWWVEHGGALDRTNIGLDFTHLNLTGHGDKLSAAFTTGYTRNYSLQYRIPYINKARNLGFVTSFSYAQNREVNYATIANKQVFYSDEERFAYSRFQGRLGLMYRPNLLQQHSFILGFNQNRIVEEVGTELNPYFFLDGRTMQRFLSFRYAFTHDARDVRAYPLDGHVIRAQVERDGLGAYGDRNAFTVYAEYSRFLPVTKRWNLALSGSAKYSLLRHQQPYNDNRAIGFYGNSLKGYEYYIIDGPDMALINSSLRFFVLDNEFNFGKLMPIEAFRRMPFKVYLTLNNDLGFVNNPHRNLEIEANPFDNRVLWGRGVGLDLVMYYDKVFRIEYSFNHLWESGVFFHFNLNI